MTLPHMTHAQAHRFRRYFEAALTGIVMAHGLKERGVDEPDPEPSGIANEAFFIAAGAMDCDIEWIEPSVKVK